MAQRASSGTVRTTVVPPLRLPEALPAPVTGEGSSSSLVSAVSNCTSTDEHCDDLVEASEGFGGPSNNLNNASNSTANGDDASVASASDIDAERCRSSQLSEKELRLLSLENISLLRKKLAETEQELEKQNELTAKVALKWKDGAMGSKLKELKKRSSSRGVDFTVIREEEKKLKDIQRETEKRMRETTTRLEQRTAELREELLQAEKQLHTEFRSLRARSLRSNRKRIETLLKKRPSIEDLVYRGIISDPVAKRRSREQAQERLSELFTSRRRSSGSYSAAWMFGSGSGSGSSSASGSSSSVANNSSGAFALPVPELNLAALQRQQLEAHQQRITEFQALLQKERILIDSGELTDLQLVAEGAFSLVYRARWLGATVAIKKMKDRENILRITQAEVISMLLCRAIPRVVKLLAVSLEPLIIVTPFYETGSLFDLLHRRRQRLSLDRQLAVAKDVASGMAAMHTLQPSLMHRDLSSNNVVLDGDGRALIIDLGISREELPAPDCHSPIGHPRLRAPEITRRQPYTKSVDVYGFGTLLFELTTGRLPYDDLPDHEASHAAAQNLLPLIPDHVHKGLRKLIFACWAAPEDRPTFKQLVFELGRIQEEEAPRMLRRSSSLRLVKPLALSSNTSNSNATSAGSTEVH